MVRRVRMVAETVLGRKFQPISTPVKRRSSLTRLPFAKIIHGSVVKAKNRLNYVKTLYRGSQWGCSKHGTRLIF